MQVQRTPWKKVLRWRARKPADSKQQSFLTLKFKSQVGPTELDLAILERFCHWSKGFFTSEKRLKSSKCWTTGVTELLSVSLCLDNEQLIDNQPPPTPPWDRFPLKLEICAYHLKEDLFPVRKMNHSLQCRKWRSMVEGMGEFNTTIQELQFNPVKFPDNLKDWSFNWLHVHRVWEHCRRHWPANIILIGYRSNRLPLSP